MEETTTAFDPRHSYMVGVLRPGSTPDQPDCELQTTGRFKAKKLHGSQLIDSGVRSLDELFRENPLRLVEGCSYDVFELNGETEARRYMGSGTPLPQPRRLMQEPAASLNDGATATNTTAFGTPPAGTPTTGATTAAANPLAGLYERERSEAERREESLARAHRNAVDTLRDELAAKGRTIEDAHRIAAQALEQNEQILSEIRTTLDTLKDVVHEKDETARELSKVTAQVDAILQLREFEERVRKERDEERKAWQERERELERAGEQQQGLGDIMESLAPFVPIVEMILSRLLPPPGTQPGMMPPGTVLPGGMPPGVMPPGMRHTGGSFGQGMPAQGMPNQGIPQRPAAHPQSAVRQQAPMNGAPTNGSASASAQETPPNGTPGGAALKVF